MYLSESLEIINNLVVQLNVFFIENYHRQFILYLSNQIL